MEPKERGQQLAPPTADAVSKTLSAPTSSPSVVSQSRTLASPNPDASVLHTDQGLPKLLSRKTLVEFPQKVVSPFRKQGSDSEAASGAGEGRMILLHLHLHPAPPIQSLTRRATAQEQVLR